MNYKKIIKSRETRIKLLSLLNFIPDKTMIKLQYYIKTGRRLNLKHPQRYTEKLQWYKLYYRDPLMQQCSDKYDVREYVKSKGLGHILNECYGVYERVEDIDFDSLPNQFVLKDTLGGGGNSVIICRKKRCWHLPACTSANTDRQCRSGIMKTVVVLPLWWHFIVRYIRETPGYSGWCRIQNHHLTKKGRP